MRTICVKVKPNAKDSRLEESGGAWTARLKSPPVDGKANRELVGLVAAEFGVPRSRVTIRRGEGGRIKTLRIDD